MKRLAKILRQEGLLPRKRVATPTLFRGMRMTAEVWLEEFPELEGHIPPVKKLIEDFVKTIRDASWNVGKPEVEDWGETDFKADYKDEMGVAPASAEHAISASVRAEAEIPYEDFFPYLWRVLSRQHRKDFAESIFELVGEEFEYEEATALRILRKVDGLGEDFVEQDVAEVVSDSFSSNNAEYLDSDFSLGDRYAPTGVSLNTQQGSRGVKIVADLSWEVSNVEICGEYTPDEPDYDSMIEDRKYRLYGDPYAADRWY